MILNLCAEGELRAVKEIALKVNEHLKDFFSKAGLDLVDFKIEFGRDGFGNLKLGDEITPDSCRLWDLKTGEKMDKDRFRRDLGRVEETYQEVCERLKTVWRSLQ
jgi:phosphoribosylaminoimidazole-succinocarboxamide synthase